MFQWGSARRRAEDERRAAAVRQEELDAKELWREHRERRKEEREVEADARDKRYRRITLTVAAVAVVVSLVTAGVNLTVVRQTTEATRAQLDIAARSDAVPVLQSVTNVPAWGWRFGNQYPRKMKFRFQNEGRASTVVSDFMLQIWVMEESRLTGRTVCHYDSYFLSDYTFRTDVQNDFSLEAGQLLDIDTPRVELYDEYDDDTPFLAQECPSLPEEAQALHYRIKIDFASGCTISDDRVMTRQEIGSGVYSLVGNVGGEVRARCTRTVAQS